MKQHIARLLIVMGTQICTLAVTVASVSPFCCRGFWYQPEEPDGLEKFFKG